jgi:hypothetical protein
MKKIVLCLFASLIVLLTSCVANNTKIRHSVTFNVSGITTLVLVNHGSVLKENQIPSTEKAGSVFNGWVRTFNDSEFIFDLTTPINMDYNLVAKYSEAVNNDEILVKVFGLEGVLL